MDTEKHFQTVADFLRQHEYLHSTEPMDRYRQSVPAPYRDWFNQLTRLTPQQLLDLENEWSTVGLSDQNLIKFISDCQQLVQVSKLSVVQADFHPYLKRKLTPKKHHEVQWILGLIKSGTLTHVIDIGSGAGHLASCLLEQDPNKTAHCIDSNAEFQQMGQKKLQRWFPQVLQRMRFENAVVDGHYSPGEIPVQSGVIGLHSCGDLSVQVLKLFEQNNLAAVINFGCCYHKSTLTNLSQLAQKAPLHFTNHALTMAAKSYSWQTEQKLQDKLRVKTYRYALHFYCIDHFGQAVTSIGNTSKSDALLPFHQYLLKYLPQKWHHQINPTADQYLHSPHFEQSFHYFLCMGTLRALLGRVIEIYLLLDRVLWLKERGKDVGLFECFERKISPRNLGIISI